MKMEFDVNQAGLLIRCVQTYLIRQQIGVANGERKENEELEKELGQIINRLYDGILKEEGLR